MNDKLVITSDEIWRIKEEMEPVLVKFLNGQCDKEQVSGMLVLHSAMVTCLEQILSPAVLTGTIVDVDNHAGFIREIVEAVIEGARDGAKELSELH